MEDKLLYLYKHIVTSSTDMLALLDKNYIYLNVNQAYLDAFHKSLDQVIGFKVYEIFGEEIFNAVIKPNAILCLTGKKVNYKHWFNFPAFGKRYMDITYYPNIGKNMKVEGFVVNGRDITDQKQAEEALRDSEERFRSLYENSTMGLYRTVQDGRIILANPALVHMLGFSSFDALAERNLNKEGFGIDYSRQNFLRLFEKEDHVKGVEGAWTKRDGEVIFIRESAKVIRDENGNIRYYEGTVEDITERKQVDEKIKIRSDELARANKLMVGRELKMIKLKKEVNELRLKSGLPIKYKAPDLAVN